MDPPVIVFGRVLSGVSSVVPLIGGKRTLLVEPRHQVDDVQRDILVSFRTAVEDDCSNEVVVDGDAALGRKTNTASDSCRRKQCLAIFRQNLEALSGFEEQNQERN